MVYTVNLGLVIVVGDDDVVDVLAVFVVFLLVVSVVTGGIDGVVAFVVFALVSIENVGVTVDRIDVDVINTVAVVVV